MNEEIKNKNKEFILNQIKYSGFENYHNKVETLFMSKNKDHTFSLEGSKANFGNKIEFDLKFRKGNNQMWFLNSYTARLTNTENQIREHSFAVKTKGITAMQALNLLEGRYSKISYLDKNKEYKESFVKLNFQEKNEKGNYKMEFLPIIKNDVFDNLLKTLVTKDEKEREILKKSLDKGSITRIRFKDETNGFAIINPKNISLDLYDINFKKIPLIKEIKQDQSKGLKV